MTDETNNQNCCPDVITPTGCFDFSAAEKLKTRMQLPAIINKSYETFLSAALTYHMSTCTSSSDENGGGGLGNACQFGMIGSMMEGGDYVPPPTYPDWTAGQIGWNAEGTVLKVSVWGTAAHFDQTPKIRIYAKGLGAGVLNNDQGGWTVVPDDPVPEAATFFADGSFSSGSPGGKGYWCNEFAHTKEPTYPLPPGSTWVEDGNNSWYGVAEIPEEHLIPHRLYDPVNTQIEVHASVIFEDQIPSDPFTTDMFTFAGNLCNVLVFDIPDKETLYPSGKYVATSTVTVVPSNWNGYEGNLLFPWFRVNTSPVHRYNEPFNEPEAWAQLTPLHPTANAEMLHHYPKIPEEEFHAPTWEELLNSINAYLAGSGIVASRLENTDFIKLESNTIFYTGPKDADGDIIGQIFEPIGPANYIP